MVLYGLCALCFFENLWNMCLQPCARVQTVVALRGILGVLILPEPASSCRRCTMGSGCLEISAGWIVSEIMLEFMLQSCWTPNDFHSFFHSFFMMLIDNHLFPAVLIGQRCLGDRKSCTACCRAVRHSPWCQTSRKCWNDGRSRELIGTWLEDDWMMELSGSECIRSFYLDFLAFRGVFDVY